MDIDIINQTLDAFLYWKGCQSMRNVILFIGMSMDGYIADQSGKVDWMSGQDKAAEGGDTY